MQVSLRENPIEYRLTREQAFREFKKKNVSDMKKLRLDEHDKTSCDRIKYHREKYYKYDEVTRKKRSNEKYLKRIEKYGLEYIHRQQKEYREKNRSLIQARKYGLTLEQYYDMMRESNGKCAICGMDVTKTPLGACIDHCHARSKVRGILCRNCNSGLGQFEDNIQYLTSAIEYLKKHG